MACRSRQSAWLTLSLFTMLEAVALPPAPLPGTRLLEDGGDLSAKMVAAIDRFAMRELERSISARAAMWNRDHSSADAFERSTRLNRDHFRRIIGAVDQRVPMSGLELVTTTTEPALLAKAERYSVWKARWPVFDAVHGEGLLLQPAGEIRARVVVLPDADETPEKLAGLSASIPAVSPHARQLAENGVQVIIPVLIDRRDEWSGSPAIDRFTNQTHREWIYRQAYEMGRHIIGYEVQKVLAAVDWFAAENKRTVKVPIGVAGYAEGGLIAFYAAALDARIGTTLVSGYFDARERIWTEPLYRNVFGLLEQFGDAEIASLIAPRTLIIEHCSVPTIGEPPFARRGRLNVAAPGAIATPDLKTVQREFNRAESLCGPFASALQLHTDREPALNAFWSSLSRKETVLAKPAAPPAALRRDFDVDGRQERQVRELERHTQALIRRAEDTREAFFWDRLKRESPEQWRTVTNEFKTLLWNELLGRLPAPDRPMNPRARVIEERRTWIGYEVVLDVWDDVFAWGYLLLPKNIRHGERRPVVVCQHGVEGLPADVVTDDITSRAYGFYQGFAGKLAERGFVVFAPHNPYRGRDDFRVLQRKLNPLGKTLYSVMIAQHGRILDWLAAQSFVDSTRIGFYGFSYGGKTAMRIPAVFDRYAVSVCSGDFNEWTRKSASVDARYSYLYSPEYEVFEFNLGNTFNYAEMAALIAPRPFMVERGDFDSAGTNEWVSYEYAKVRRLYTELRIPGRTAIEYFDGPHRINAVGTFDFLHAHLAWPKPRG